MKLSEWKCDFTITSDKTMNWTNDSYFKSYMHMKKTENFKLEKKSGRRFKVKKNPETNSVIS